MSKSAERIKDKRQKLYPNLNADLVIEVIKGKYKKDNSLSLMKRPLTPTSAPQHKHSKKKYKSYPKIIIRNKSKGYLE